MIISTSIVNRSVDPSPWFRKMRAESPVAFDPDIVYYFGRKGGWQVFRYEDIRNSLANAETFSSEFIPKQNRGLGDSIAFTDPPRHKQLRSLIARAFTPAILARLEIWLKDRCRAELLPKLEAGKMDFIQDYAEQLPASVIAQLLGIPEDYHKTITCWTKSLIGDPTEIGPEAYQQIQQEMAALFTEQIRYREQNPREDLLTYLVQSKVDGKRLSQDDLIANSIALLTAGTEAPTSLLGNTMLTLAERPALQYHLAEHTEDIPKVINEVLRFRCPVLSIPRLVRQDTIIGGQAVKQGELVNFWLASGNLDPSVFPLPDTFDIYRDHSKILSFGHGIHACIGSFLTRMELKTSFEIILKHTRHISIAPENVLRRLPNVSTFKFESLVVKFNESL